MLVNGKRERVTYETLETYGDDFGDIGNAFDAAHPVTIGKISNAEVRFFKQRAVVDYAVEWIEKNRNLEAQSE
jgi:aminoglycoside 3-N-acetyltransferase